MAMYTAHMSTFDLGQVKIILFIHCTWGVSEHGILKIPLLSQLLAFSKETFTDYPVLWSTQNLSEGFWKFYMRSYSYQKFPVTSEGNENPQLSDSHRLYSDMDQILGVFRTYRYHSVHRIGFVVITFLEIFTAFVFLFKWYIYVTKVPLLFYVHCVQEFYKEFTAWQNGQAVGECLTVTLLLWFYNYTDYIVQECFTIRDMQTVWISDGECDIRPW